MPPVYGQRPKFLEPFNLDRKHSIVDVADDYLRSLGDDEWYGCH